MRLIGILCLLALPAIAQEPAARVDDLSWMAGCWEGAQGRARMQEQWMAPLGDSLLGTSRVVAGDKTPECILRVALGIGKKDTPFKRIAGREGEAIFENPEHDFPQRIIYRRDGSGLFARIEGVEKGKSKGQDFHFKQISCR